MFGFDYVDNCASELYCWFRTPASARSYPVSVFLLDWLSYFSVKRIDSFIHSYLSYYGASCMRAEHGCTEINYVVLKGPRYD